LKTAPTEHQIKSNVGFGEKGLIKEKAVGAQKRTNNID